jgi:hypothetical protein
MKISIQPPCNPYGCCHIQIKFAFVNGKRLRICRHCSKVGSTEGTKSAKLWCVLFRCLLKHIQMFFRREMPSDMMPVVTEFGCANLSLVISKIAHRVITFDGYSIGGKEVIYILDADINQTLRQLNIIDGSDLMLERGVYHRLDFHLPSSTLVYATSKQVNNTVKLSLDGSPLITLLTSTCQDH